MKSRSLIGRKLGNYQVKRLLGRGGMAEVYYGWDEKLHRHVAIKVIEVQNRTKRSQASRFIQEARVMANWRHENIIPIYHAGDETGIYYYVMEYIDGFDLASIMSVYAEKGELMPTSDVLRIGDTIANALDYAHKQGVIHRDVKPANVLIADDGHVALGDFGLALDLRDKSQGEVFGSPHYISPEQARRSSDAVPQSDLYSLGVILYEMLTGATPFNDPSPATLALQHISETPPSPRSINPSLSPKIEEILLKALEKKPASRYQSGRELMDALRKALTAKPATRTDAASSMPPIPVGAPTIHRNTMSLNSFTKRDDIRNALEKTKHGRLENVPDLVGKPKNQKKTKRRFGWLIFFALLIAALGTGYYFRPDLFSGIPLPPLDSLLPAAPTQTVAAPAVIPPTDSPSPEPTGTHTKTITPTTAPSATATRTSLPTNTPTETITPTPTVSPEPTIKYPDGYHMTAFYNENSFYILNRGRASRSESGFIFERINNDGTFGDQFAGWEWEKEIFMVIRPDRCMSLEIFQSEEPYLKPVECENKTQSNLEPMIDSGKIFWTPNDTSRQFRILWQNEEIARCEIEAGVCDFYVP